MADSQNPRELHHCRAPASPRSRFPLGDGAFFEHLLRLRLALLQGPHAGVFAFRVKQLPMRAAFHDASLRQDEVDQPDSPADSIPMILREGVPPMSRRRRPRRDARSTTSSAANVA